ncbi:MAG: hypothetical protein AB1422_01085 [bacterium]
MKVKSESEIRAMLSKMIDTLDKEFMGSNLDYGIQNALTSIIKV